LGTTIRRALQGSGADLIDSRGVAVRPLDNEPERIFGEQAVDDAADFLDPIRDVSKSVFGPDPVHSTDLDQVLENRAVIRRIHPVQKLGPPDERDV
jgi:hypothetical protein